MSGYYLKCRERTDGVKCSTIISADSKEELLKETLQHLLSVHGRKESMALDDQLRAQMKRGKKVA